MDEEVTALVLRNKGTPVRLIVLDEAGGERIGPEGTPMLEQHWVRYTNNEIADFEDRFGGERRDMPVLDLKGDPTLNADGTPKMENRLLDPAEVFNEQLRIRGRHTVRFMLSLGLHVTEQQAGAVMAPDLFDEYVTAVGCSYYIAMGIDPFVVKKMYDAGLTITTKLADIRPEVAGEMSAIIDEAVRLVSLGRSGSRSGRRSAARQKSSGTSRRGK